MKDKLAEAIKSGRGLEEELRQGLPSKRPEMNNEHAQVPGQEPLFKPGWMGTGAAAQAQAMVDAEDRDVRRRLGVPEGLAADVVSQLDGEPPVQDDVAYVPTPKGAGYVNQDYDRVPRWPEIEDHYQMARQVADLVVGSQAEITEVEQMAVMLAAFWKFRERQVQYGDTVWRAVGWRGQLYEMRKKLERVWHQFMLRKPGHQPDLDNAIDLMNYVAFFVRQVMANEANGNWPWEAK